MSDKGASGARVVMADITISMGEYVVAVAAEEAAAAEKYYASICW